MFFINFRASCSSRPFVSLRLSGLYFQDLLYLTLPSSMIVMMSASLWPGAQPIKILDCLSSLILLQTSTLSKKPTALFCVLSPVCASCGVVFTVSPSRKSASLSTRNFCIHSAGPTAHCATRWSRIISTLRRLASSTKICKRSLNARTRCCARHLLDSAQLLSLQSAIPTFWLFCVQLRASTFFDHSTLECFRNVSAAL